LGLNTVRLATKVVLSKLRIDLLTKIDFSKKSYRIVLRTCYAHQLTEPDKISLILNGTILWVVQLGEYYLGNSVRED
jgi:hypothetical protein